MPNKRLSQLLLRTVILAVLLLVTPIVPATPVAPANAAGADRPRADALRLVPVYFEANSGQADPQVKFLSRGPDHTLFLTGRETVLVLTRRPGSDMPSKQDNIVGAVLRTTFIDANPQTRVTGEEELSGKAHYFVGNDPAKWRTNVRTYTRVRYTDLYPGIDLVYYRNPRQLEYDFIVAPGADPTRIALAFQGADRLEVDARGDLVLHTAGGVIRQRKPVVYQEIDGVRREVAADYVVKARHEVRIKVAAYDRRRPLVIDPALVYSTFLGGTGAGGDSALGIAVDGSGHAYVTGTTTSMDFPVTFGAFDTMFNGNFDLYVTKLTPDGSALVYSTFLGGAGFDFAHDFGGGIAVDAHGTVYVTGRTFSPDFPTTPGAFDTTYNGDQEAFVTALSPDGSALVYSTFLGGPASDQGAGIAVDQFGQAYIVGETFSPNFPFTADAFDTTFNGACDAFVAKLSADGSALIYSTFLGGSGCDTGLGLALDNTGEVYVTGRTNSPGFPTTPGAFDTTLGSVDAFVTKLSADGSALVYSTFLGGSFFDDGFGIAVDDGNAYVTGSTNSRDFPTTPGAFDVTLNAPTNAFVTKLSADGSALVYSTFLGGTFFDFGGRGIAVDPSGHAYVVGATASRDFPTTIDGFDITPGQAFGGTDGFLTKLSRDGSALAYSTYIGGTASDFASDVAVVSSGDAYVVGTTQSRDNFPTTPGAFDRTLGLPSDGFVMRFDTN